MKETGLVPPLLKPLIAASTFFVTFFIAFRCAFFILLPNDLTSAPAFLKFTVTDPSSTLTSLFSDDDCPSPYREDSFSRSALRVSFSRSLLLLCRPSPAPARVGGGTLWRLGDAEWVWDSANGVSPPTL